MTGTRNVKINSSGADRAPCQSKGALHIRRNDPDGADRSPPLPQQFDGNATAKTRVTTIAARSPNLVQ